MRIFLFVVFFFICNENYYLLKGHEQGKCNDNKCIYKGGKLSLEAKEYKLWDTIAIPMKITPAYTGLLLVNEMILGMIPAVQIVIFTNFIDTAISIFKDQANYKEIFGILLGLLGVIAYINIQQNVKSLVMIKFNMKLTETYHVQMIEKRAKLKYECIENDEIWDLISRTCGQDVGRLQEGFSLILSMLRVGFNIISVVVMIAQAMWLGALIIVLVAIPVLKISLKAGKQNYKASQEASRYKRKEGYLKGILTSRGYVEERTLFSYTEVMNTKWYEAFEAVRKINMKMQIHNFVTMKVSSIITVFISISVVAVLIFPLHQGIITIGFFMSLIMASFDLVQMMSWELSYMMSTLANYQQYLKELSLFSELAETKGAVDLPVANKAFKFEQLAFKNVSFKYPNTERYILKNFSVQLEANKRYAIVGINGSGKTTLTKLLVGLYDDYEGEILINHKELRKYQYEELKAMFAVVHQDFVKYQISVKDNVYIGTERLQIKSGDYKELEKLGILDYLEGLPQGMETYLGKIKSGGTDLSVGQWQKIAIARALMRNAPITILDEPTAALDPVAEAAVYKLFEKISLGRSTISITHRLGVSKQADKIIVINDGTVVEEGNHHQLIQCQGIYAQMFESQRSWY